MLLWFSASGYATNKTVPLLRNFSKQSTATKVLLPNFKNSGLKFKYSKVHKKVDFRVDVLKGIKRKATNQENNLLPDFYFTDFITLRCYKGSLIYGIATAYCIQRHTYLHLYQLF